MTEKDNMLKGLPYRAWLGGLAEERLECRKKLRDYNLTGPWDEAEMDRQIKGLLGSTGERICVTPPFYCDYGSNIHVGENFYSNFHLTILDVAEVRIGANAMFGPNVAIYTAGHPLHPDTRNTGVEWGCRITIGESVWLGGNVVVCPGVTIGNNVVVGAGAVVTKDLPDNTICAGNPARVIRQITEEDRQYYRRDLKWPPGFDLQG